MNIFNLNKKVILITGGGGFLAKYFAEIIITYDGIPVLIDHNYQGLLTNKRYLENKFSVKVSTYKCDLCKENEVSLLFKKINKNFKTIEVLINNAAPNPTISKLSNRNNALEEFKIRNWKNDIDSGLTSAFLCIKYFSRYKNKSQENILNISSDLGIVAPNQNLYKVNNKISYKPVSYSVMKHGIIGLTKYCSTYFISRNIRCNALAFGGVENNQPKNFIKKVNKLIPMGRLAKKDEYGPTIIYMISNASSYMNGSTVVVDGGRTVW